MVKKIVSKVMWVGRATVFLVGLTVILAVVLGVATTAVAHSGAPGMFHLGHDNPVTALSKMTGSVANGVLQVTNQSTGNTTQDATAITATNNSAGSPTIRASNNKGSPAMELNVACPNLLQCNRGAPMTVNSSARVDGLNADLLDGMDSTDFVAQQDVGQFWSGRVYSFSNLVEGGTNGNNVKSLQCDDGDLAIGGGYAFSQTGYELHQARVQSDGLGGGFYALGWTDTNGTPDTVSIGVSCADFPPFRGA